MNGITQRFILLLAAACGWAGAQEATPAATVTSALSVGFTQPFRPRLPLEDFSKLHPEVVLTELGWPRNVLKWHDPPLPQALTALPAVLLLTAGHFSDDVRQLSERGLLHPVEPLLAELGVAREDFPPAALEAFTLNGALWAIPHHAAAPVLRVNSSVFATAQPQVSSWEALFADAAPLLAQRGAPGPKRLFCAPYSAARLAEIIAMSSGTPPLDLADPVFVSSEGFRKALRFVLDALAAGRLHLRQMNTPLAPDAGLLMGIDFSNSVHADADYAVVDMPARILEADAPAARPRVPGFIEGIAFRAHSPAERGAALTFARWLLSPDTEWKIFELTNQETPSKDWLLDGVHVPLRATALSSIDFEYAAKKFPAFPVLRAHLDKAVYPKTAAALELRVWELIEAKVDYLKPDEDLASALKALELDVRDVVRKTRVESAAYAEY